MLLPVFQDLIKPQWRLVIESLKLTGGLPVSDLARRLDCSYMTVKTHCDELAEAGYLIRSRLPRTEVGRPEIFYSLAGKADALFPQAGIDFVLELLDELRIIHGNNAPDRLLFQHFSKTAERFSHVISPKKTIADKMRRFAEMREKDGHVCRCEIESDDRGRLLEFHNPLSRVFGKFPRAVTLEQQMIEQLLGCRITRREISAGPEAPTHVVFETT